MTKFLLSGNEAIAQGAWESAVCVGVGYPGTPSTETLEYYAKLPNTYAEWAPNEKVALETGIGVSAAGSRALVTMKHVGVNVAADPLLSCAYTGINGGLVLLAADDPGIYSSQNEQDSRNYAAFARVPMLEPSDSAEALEFTKRAFNISERMDTLVMIRSTVRLSHTKTLVEVGEQEPFEPLPYEKNVGKWVMMPANAKVRRKDADERIERLEEYAEICDLNREEIRDTKIGIVCSGTVYQHVREALPNASVFKLGMSYPLPPKRLAAFAKKVDSLYVVEEACDFFNMRIRAMGIKVAETPNPLPPDDELTPGRIASAFNLEAEPHVDSVSGLPGRPPSLCTGCPHRLVFAELRRIHARVCGDIGCYTLGSLPPLSCVDTCVDMGASISMAHGMELAAALDESSEKKNPIVAVIGDSTFAHSGITSLLSAVYNRTGGTVAILDNRTTAMTGQQGNPVNGVTLQNRPSRELVLLDLVRALGVDDVRQVDPQDMQAVRTALKEATQNDDLSVIIFQSPCALLTRVTKPAYHIEPDECKACGVCVSLGCPALGKEPETGIAHIDEEMCIGCGQCTQYCTFNVIKQVQIPEGGER